MLKEFISEGIILVSRLFEYPNGSKASTRKFQDLRMHLWIICLKSGKRALTLSVNSSFSGHLGIYKVLIQAQILYTIISSLICIIFLLNASGMPFNCLSNLFQILSLKCLYSTKWRTRLFWTSFHLNITKIVTNVKRSNFLYNTILFI